MCGKVGDLFTVKVEGTTLDVCSDCARFGTIISEPKRGLPILNRSRPQIRRPEVTFIIVETFGEKIKIAREDLGLTQEEFSKKLNEKSSIMQKIETGHVEPTIDQARKFEKILKIKLVEEFVESGQVPIEAHREKTEGFTMGDFLKKR
jgi:putative transcription factor